MYKLSVKSVAEKVIFCHFEGLLILASKSKLGYLYENIDGGST